MGRPIHQLLFVLTAILLINPILLSQEGQKEIVGHNRHKAQLAIDDSNFHKAIAYYNRFVKDKNLYPYDKHNRGVCYFRLGDVESACRDYMDGVKQNSNSLKFLCDSTFKLEKLQTYFYTDESLSAGNGFRPKYTKEDTLRGALRPERTCFDVHYYNLNIRINPRKKSIEGYNEIHFIGKNKSNVIQLDLFPNFSIERIIWGDLLPLDYHREYGAIFINLPQSIETQKKYKITVFYKGKPRKAPNPPWDGGFVWSRDRWLRHWVGVSCEHLGASSWWPNKDHLSDRPDSMSISVEVPSKYQAICNGTLQNVVKVNDKFTRYEWHINYPINNYNVTFYMGKYSEFTDTLAIEGDTLVKRYHVMPYHLEKAKRHFSQDRNLLLFYHDYFGPFPFPEDNFRMVESPYQGMEHQTAIAYGNDYEKSYKKSRYKTAKLDYIIVHEAAHEWWGNSLAATDMADIWLHEGFATYAEYLYIEHLLGYNEYQSEMVRISGSIYNQWPMVENYDVNENAFAGNDVYHKGAVMLHCLRTIINNDSLFKHLIKNFHLKYRDSVITTQTFVDYAQPYSHTDLTPFFAVYLYKTSLPVLNYSLQFRNDSLVFNYSWEGVEKGFEMPFAVKRNKFKEDAHAEENLAVRLVGRTKVQTKVFPNTKDITFFTYTNPSIIDDCPKHGYTYYHTKCIDCHVDLELNDK